jgi:hypothetical protein
VGASVAACGGKGVGSTGVAVDGSIGTVVGNMVAGASIGVATDELATVGVSNGIGVPGSAGELTTVGVSTPVGLCTRVGVAEGSGVAAATGGLRGRHCNRRQRCS